MFLVHRGRWERKALLEPLDRRDPGERQEHRGRREIRVTWDPWGLGARRGRKAKKVIKGTEDSRDGQDRLGSKDGRDRQDAKVHLVQGETSVQWDPPDPTS